MFFGLSIVLVTVLSSISLASPQSPPAQTANGFRVPAKTTAADPAKALSPEMRGDILMARKMYREAIETYLQGPKDSPIMVNKIGIAYHQLLDLESAKKQYERAIKLDSRYAEAINNLGTVFYARKSYRRAVNEYRKALRINPESASFLSNLGTAYYARKQYTEMAVAYQKALEIDPDVFERRSSTGTTLQERSVEERAKYHYFQAKIYAKSGQMERALMCIRKALEEGFKEKEKFLKDPEFAVLKDNQEFKLLMAAEQKVI
ncbi:MAG TPA: tetratricopeptide repeat protein [Bryobacteraceae bacterium]|nr:tetratricopeptide repeat protein [Bryobacteraceae bacterium]